MNNKILDEVRQARRLIEEIWEAWRSSESSDSLDRPWTCPWTDSLDRLWHQNYSRARSLLEHRLVSNPENILLLTVLGAVLSDQGNHDDAAKLLRKAVENGSNDRNTFFNLGVAVLNSGAGEKDAIKWFKKASTLDAHPESWEAYFDPHAH